MSFLPHQCHSFRITVIPSVLLSFLPDHCHSFRIIVIPSILVSFLPNIVIPSVLLSFLPDHCHSFRIIVIPSILVSFLPNIVIPSKLFRELQILTSSKSFPYPKGEKNGHRRWPYMRVIHKKLNKSCSLDKIFFLEKKMLVEKKLLFRFSQKDTYLKFSFLFPSVLLSCYHH